MRVQPAVKKETLHIAAGTGLMTAVMLLVFLLLGRLTLPVVLGALLGACFAVLNFFCWASPSRARSGPAMRAAAR